MMIRRSTLIAVEVLLGLVAALAIGLGVAWWRLSQGPIELNAMRERAVKEIQQAKQAAVAELYTDATNLATMVAGKILKREINSQDQQRLVEESLGQLQGLRN